jgi:hypothetical protein
MMISFLVLSELVAIGGPRPRAAVALVMVHYAHDVQVRKSTARRSSLPLTAHAFMYVRIQILD